MFNLHQQRKAKTIRNSNLPVLNHPKNAIFVTMNAEYSNTFNTIPDMGKTHALSTKEACMRKTFRVNLPEFSFAMPMSHFTKQPVAAMLLL